jgi:hypothetical protein
MNGQDVVNGYGRCAMPCVHFPFLFSRVKKWSSCVSEVARRACSALNDFLPHSLALLSVSLLSTRMSVRNTIFMVATAHTCTLKDLTYCYLHMSRPEIEALFSLQAGHEFIDGTLSDEGK